MRTLIVAMAVCLACSAEAQAPFSPEQGVRIFEDACHAGNRSLEGILAGARAEERRAKAKR